MGQKYYSRVLLLAEQDPDVHFFQGVQERFQESKPRHEKINVRDTSTCPDFVPERQKLELAVLTA